MGSNNKDNYKLEFSRHEHKYYVPRHIENELLKHFSERCYEDKYNKGLKTYTVNSIYMDTPEFTFYRDKIDGYPHRSKVRLRTYSRDFDKGDNYFLEIKSKTYDKMYKERTPLSRKMVKDILDGKINFMDIPKSEKVFQRVRNMNLVAWLKPVSKVIYDRISFYDRLDDFKISFDFDTTSYHPKSELAPGQNFSSIFNMNTIMEFKFQNEVPRYALDVVKKHSLQRTAISKYCSSIDLLYN